MLNRRTGKFNNKKNNKRIITENVIGGGGPYSTIEYGPGSIEKLLYEV